MSDLLLMETAVTITEGKDGIRYLDHDVPLEDYPLNLTIA